jgi:hypothetical protein
VGECQRLRRGDPPLDDEPTLISADGRWLIALTSSPEVDPDYWSPGDAARRGWDIQGHEDWNEGQKQVGDLGKHQS